jgi:hypothetical protein
LSPVAFFTVVVVSPSVCHESPKVKESSLTVFTLKTLALATVLTVERSNR